MQRPIIEQAHPATKLLFVAVFIIASFLITMIVAALIALLFFSPSEVLGAFSGNLQNIGILKYFQMAQSIGIFIIPALLTAVFFGKNTRKYLYFSSRNVTLIPIILAALIILAAMPLIDFTGFLNQQMTLPDYMQGIEEWMFQMEENSKIIIAKFTKVHTASGLIINIIMIGVLPALGEEMLFRGTIQPLMKSWLKHTHAAVWVTAFIFSAMHMQFYGFLPRLLLGAVMGYMLVWSGTLWLPIIAHFVNNTAGVIMYFLFYNNMVTLNPDDLGYSTEILPIVISICCVSGFLYLFKKLQLPPENSNNESLLSTQH